MAMTNTQPGFVEEIVREQLNQSFEDIRWELFVEPKLRGHLARYLQPRDLKRDASEAIQNLYPRPSQETTLQPLNIDLNTASGIVGWLHREGRL